MNRFATSLVALTLAFAATACKDAPTYPDDDYDPEDYAQHDFSVRDPGFGFELPPLEPQPTFWSCAAGHEGNFADAAARIIQLETKAWFESDYRIQQALLQQGFSTGRVRASGMGNTDMADAAEDRVDILFDGY